MGEDMTFNNNDFKVRWQDKEGNDREKVYTDPNSRVALEQAKKACKWLNDNGAVADIAVIKRIKPSDGDEAEGSGMFPSK